MVLAQVRHGLREWGDMATGSASDLLRADHRQIEMRLDRLLISVKHRGEGIVSEVRDVFAEIRQLMELHVRKEEMVVYPFLRTKFPEVLGKMGEQHQYIAEVTAGMDELTGMDGMSLTERQCEELISLSKELFDVIQHHIVDEEDQLLRLADFASFRARTRLLGCQNGKPGSRPRADRDSDIGPLPERRCNALRIDGNGGLLPTARRDVRALARSPSATFLASFCDLVMEDHVHSETKD